MRVLPIIDSMIEAAVDNTGRTQRQFLSIRKWAIKLFRGTVVACTGFGKTRIGLEAIKLLRRNDPSRKVIVVVPRIPIKLQWIDILQKANQLENTEVWVINSLSALPEIKTCHLLICDEIHHYAARTFSKVFQVVRYNYILGLTATIERSDGKHILLQRNAPVFDNIPLHLARKNGWVAAYEVFNWGIKLSEGDRQEYDTLYGKDSKLNKYMSVFEYDINTVIKCAGSNKPLIWGGRVVDSSQTRIARSLGWRGKSAVQALNTLRTNKTKPRGQKENIWGGDLNHMYHPDKIVIYAIQARRIIEARKEYINNHPLKTEAVVKAYNFFKKKTISFCETKSVAKQLQQLIGDKAVSYYSDMDSEYRIVTKSKAYKTKSGAEKFIAKHPDIKFDLKEKDAKFTISWQEKKLFGEKKLKEEALKKLSDNRYKIDFISSVRSLNEGVDIPDLEIALIHSRNSTSKDNIQRTGRVSRLFIYKDGSGKQPKIINVYLVETKDEDWLKNGTKGMPGVKWISSLEETISEEEIRLIA